jgi:hypothetical protein
LVAACCQSLLAPADRHDGASGRSRHRDRHGRDVGTAVGTAHPPARARSRQRIVPSHTLREQSRTAMDRKGRGVPLPLCPQPWALPFLAVLAPTPGVSEPLGLRQPTVGARARHMVRLLHRWLPGRAICVRGQTAYRCLALGVLARWCGVTLITPARLESALDAPPSPPDTILLAGMAPKTNSASVVL